MLDCKKLLDYLTAYLDGDLDEGIRLEMEQHIRHCSRAKTILHTFEQTIVLHHRGFQGRGAVPPDVRIRLHEAVRQCMEEEQDE